MWNVSVAAAQWLRRHFCLRRSWSNVVWPAASSSGVCTKMCNNPVKASVQSHSWATWKIRENNVRNRQCVFKPSCRLAWGSLRRGLGGVSSFLTNCQHVDKSIRAVLHLQPSIGAIRWSWIWIAFNGRVRCWERRAKFLNDSTAPAPVVYNKQAIKMEIVGKFGWRLTAWNLCISVCVLFYCCRPRKRERGRWETPYLRRHSSWSYSLICASLGCLTIFHLSSRFPSAVLFYLIRKKKKMSDDLRVRQITNWKSLMYNVAAKFIWLNVPLSSLCLSVQEPRMQSV